MLLNATVGDGDGRETRKGRAGEGSGWLDQIEVKGGEMWSDERRVFWGGERKLGCSERGVKKSRATPGSCGYEMWIEGIGELGRSEEPRVFEREVLQRAGPSLEAAVVAVAPVDVKRAKSHRLCGKEAGGVGSVQPDGKDRVEHIEGSL